MPNYLYVLKNENDEIIDEIWEIRNIKDRKKPIEKNGNIYTYKPEYSKSDPLFLGAGWTSNSRIYYEDPDVFKARQKTEKLRVETAKLIKGET